MDIPKWLESLSKTSRSLPLEARKKMLPLIMDRLESTGVLKYLVGKELSQASMFMAEFLSGSGKPRNLYISEKDWIEMINSHSEGKWTPSTNPKFHSKKGWEWKQIEPRYVNHEIINQMQPKNEASISGDLCNVLGSRTTLRRRPLGKGRYEYQIAEDFDLSHGTSKSGEAKYTSGFERTLPKNVGNLIRSVFPEYIEEKPVLWEEWTEDYVRTSSQFGDNRSKSPGKSVPIVSKYIHSTKIEYKIVDRFKKEENFPLQVRY